MSYAAPIATYPTAFAKTQEALLSELKFRTAHALSFGESLLSLSAKQLNHRPAENAWSALECLVHLNDYADMYLSKIEARVQRAPTRSKAKYRPGFLGRRLALALHPNNRSKKMRSPAKTNHLHADLQLSVRDVFVANLRRYQDVLNQLGGKELRGSKVPFSFTPLVQFHLGDIIACLVWHHDRHLLQAEEALATAAAQ